MAKIIIAINAGSSSVKASVYKVNKAGEEPSQLAEAQISGLTAPPAKFDYKRGSQSIKGQEIKDKVIKSQYDAFETILTHLTSDSGLKEIEDKDDISIACHRVVHGGDYTEPKEINQDTFHHIEELTDLAPLHNASALEIVKACTKLLPKTMNVAHFDSAFHQTLPNAARTYAIDQKIAKKNGLRKYGFHGISYSFITRAVAQHLEKDPLKVSIIALHLGSGASICAIKNGKSIDTTMGLTPLDGLPGATRSGSVDPSLIFHFTHEAGRPSAGSSKELHITAAEDILNKQSGWKAITGTTDFSKIASSKEPECKLAFDLFVDRILGYVGGYYVKLGGEVDALVFAGGIGEKSAKLREVVVGRCKCLGFDLDATANGKKVEDIVQVIGTKGAEHQTLICQTDEQFEMARACCMDSNIMQ